jgi:hypothetical protein
MEFQCRTVLYDGFQRIVVLQDKNGPCPLIALANILSLRGVIRLMPLVCSKRKVIAQQDLSTELIGYVVSVLSSQRNPLESNERYLHEILESLPKISRGLDINLKFTDIFSFEPTAECDIFDVCSVPIVHGMVIDESLTELAREAGSKTYNIMIEAVTEGKAPRFAAWIEEHPSMLTWKGLFELNLKLAENQLYCLFRNNHFSVITKQRNVLYTLVTDAELANAYPNRPWESLVDCDGSGSEFVDGHFGCTPAPAPLPLMQQVHVAAQPVPQNNRREVIDQVKPRAAGAAVSRSYHRNENRLDRPLQRGKDEKCCCML